MLQRLYVHNFRCFENFEFKLQDETAALLLGRNGSGKSTIKRVLALFQSIGRGKTRVGELLKPTDFTQGRTQVPMRFELEVLLEGRTFVYALALELPERFRELRVREERLSMDGEVLFSREIAEVKVNRKPRTSDESAFTIDWHMIAIPLIHGSVAPKNHPSLTTWMSNMLILSPIPQNIVDVASGVDVAIHENATNLADWLDDLLDSYPAAYTTMMEHLQYVIPDLASFRFVKLGRDARSLHFQFKQDQSSFELPLSALSDGEKCFVLSAVLLAASQHGGPIFAFWDEPDAHIAIHEVKQFVFALKRSFLRNKGQLLITSHNPETVMCFPEENTWVMGRRSHLEPSIVRCLDELSPVSSNDAEASSLMQRLLDGELLPWL